MPLLRYQDTNEYEPGEELDDPETWSLLQAIYNTQGYDFRDYAAASIRRRVRHRVRAEGLASIAELEEKVLHEPAYLERFLLGLSVNVSAMFRDPSFYARFRTEVVPHLRTYPFVRIWHAGCSTGEEVYSMAILMKEEALYDLRWVGC